MIDINELRRLAQAATPGGWYVERGNYVYGCKEVTDGEEEWHPVIACTDDDEVSINFEGNANFIAAANPAVINELLDRLEAAESDALEQARLNGMGASREAALMAKVEAAEKDIALKERVIDSLGAELNAVAKERDALRAKIEQMEKQEPVAAQHRFRHPHKNMPNWAGWWPCGVSNRPAWEVDSQGNEVEYRALYLAYGAKGE